MANLVYREGQVEVKILCDSISKEGVRLTTFEVLYHRFIHSEVMTHRMLSKNAASSRAIPSNKLLDIVRKDPMMPVEIGKNKAGMQASEQLTDEIANKFTEQWKSLGQTVAVGVQLLQELGAHKQIVNRPLEAFLPVRVVMSGTDWDNFYELRDSEFAQPEFALIARMLRKASNESVPVLLNKGDWHLPYIGIDDICYVADNISSRDYGNGNKYWNTLCALSAGRCARVTHALGGLSQKEINEEIETGRKLFQMKHMSPFEHIATPWDVTKQRSIEQERLDCKASDLLNDLTDWLSTPNSICPAWADVKNFRGWRQLRSFIEHKEIVI